VRPLRDLPRDFDKREADHAIIPAEIRLGGSVHSNSRLLPVLRLPMKPEMKAAIISGLICTAIRLPFEISASATPTFNLPRESKLLNAQYYHTLWWLSVLKVASSAVLLSERRGKGIGARDNTCCVSLPTHYPIQRIEAATPRSPTGIRRTSLAS
jgi:hypothetical protein